MTDRGAKHMEELAAAIGSGARAVEEGIIQIASPGRFAVARDIDPAFAAAFHVARGQGVQMLAWRCNVNLNGIDIAAPVPIIDE